MAGERRLALLGILLQALHVLFGVTAIIGVLIAHVRLDSVQGTPYHSHLRWQIITFWSGLLAYALATWLWLHLDLRWPVLVVAGFVAYRLTISVYHWLNARPIERWL